MYGPSICHGHYFGGPQAREYFIRYENEVYGGEPPLKSVTAPSYPLEEKINKEEKRRRLDKWYAKLVPPAPPQHLVPSDLRPMQMRKRIVLR